MRICERQLAYPVQNRFHNFAMTGCRHWIKAILALTLLFVGLPSEVLFAQQRQAASPLTLAQAVKIALEKNPQHKAALAETEVASAEVKQTQSVLYPHFMFSETATAGNDPVYVFGGKLRHQHFDNPDFALNALNTPLPFGNFSTRVGGTWNLFDSLASWRSVHRAEQAKDASLHGLERADQEIVYRVVGSYYAVQLASRQLDVAQQAMQTAEAILGRSKNRVESGVAVESDSLSAQVRLSSRKQELIRAQNNVSMARAQWIAALGLPTQEEFDPADDLAERALPLQSLEGLEKQAVEQRPDLKGIRSVEAAQELSVSIAKSSFGPRVNAFADWEADNPTLLAGGGGSNWLAGVEVQIDLFEGGAKRAELARERAQREKIAAARESAIDGVRLEVRKAYYDEEAARLQLEMTRAAIAESKESLRINQDRYDAGLTTVTDLLAAEEAARRAQADYWETLCRTYTSYAALELAGGTLNPQSPVVAP